MKKLAFLTTLFFVGIASLLSAATVFAENAVKPVISIIIDDIGYRMREDLRAIGLFSPDRSGQWRISVGFGDSGRCLAGS